MDQKLEQEIENIEEEFIKSRQQFTALDIGNCLKRRGINVRQRDVSPVVRRHFNSSDTYSGNSYTRTLIPVDNSEKSAFVYFHISDTPDSYLDRNQTPLEWDPAKEVFSDDTTNPVKKSTGVSISLDLYIGSRNSDVFHLSGCMYAGRIKPENLIHFTDVSDALNQSYHQCKKQ